MASDDNSDKTIPQEYRGDLPHLTAKVLLSLLPGVGGALVEVFNHLVAPPIEKRRDRWLQMLQIISKPAQGKVSS